MPGALGAVLEWHRSGSSALPVEHTALLVDDVAVSLVVPSQAPPGDDSVAVQPDAPNQNTCAARQEEPFSVGYTERGLINQIGFRQVESPEASRLIALGLLRTIEASLQVAAPPSPSERDWSADERDAVGLVRTRYRRIGPKQIQKTKVEYQSVSSSPMTDARTEIVGARRSVFGFSGPDPSMTTLERVLTEETTRVVSQGPLPKLASKVEIAIKLLDTRKLAPSELRRLARAVQPLPRAPLDDRSAENRMSVDRTKLEGSSYGALLSELAEVPADDKKRRARLFALLKTHLRFEEESVSDAERRIRAGDPQKGTLIDALGSAGSARAQEVLQGIARERAFSDEDRRRALISLSFVERPSPETLVLLHDLESDPLYGTQALYGIGLAAYNLQESDPDAARDLAVGLTQTLDDADDPNQEIRALKALGNAGHPESLEEVEARLHDPDPAIRAAMAWAGEAPVLVPELERLAESDADQKIRELLRDWNSR